MNCLKTKEEGHPPYLVDFRCLSFGCHPKNPQYISELNGYFNRYFLCLEKKFTFQFVCHIVVIASYFTDGVQHVRLFPADVRGARGLVRLVSQVKVL